MVVTVAGGEPAPAKYFLIMMVLNKLKPMINPMSTKTPTNIQIILLRKGDLLAIVF